MTGERRGEKVFKGPTIRTPLGMLFGQSVPVTDKDREKQKKKADRVVERVRDHYMVRSVRFDDAGVYVTVIMDRDSNEKAFDSLRLELRDMDMYPRIARSGGDWTIVVYPFPTRKKRKITTNVVMLLLTLFTTVWAGAFIWMGREGLTEPTDIFSVLTSPTDMLMGMLTFAFPLLLILGTHELGHYFTSRRYRVDASLPYFIPIPPIISPFGTFGALISMRENMSNRKALVDIGVAGPIAGFIVAIPVTIIGLILTNTYPASSELIDGGTYMIFNDPIIMNIFSLIIPVKEDTVVFPTVIAGWIGFLVTALNLMPIGQLDGGHITRGILGDRARYISYGAVLLLVIMGLVTQFTSYLIFAFLIMLMGTRHPPPLDDFSPLSRRQYAAGAFAVLMMVLCFHPVPIELMEASSPDVRAFGPAHNVTVSHEAPARMDISLVNGASSSEAITMTIEHQGASVVPEHLYPELDLDKGTFQEAINASQLFFVLEDWYVFSESPSERRIPGEGIQQWTFYLASSSNVTTGTNTSFLVHFSYSDKLETVEVNIVKGHIGAFAVPSRLTGENAYRVEGHFHMFSTKDLNAGISLAATDGGAGWDILLIPHDPANWSSDGGAIFRASSDEGEGANVTLGNISWSEGAPYHEEPFTLEVWLKGDPGHGGLTITLTIDGGDLGKSSMDVFIQ